MIAFGKDSKVWVENNAPKEYKDDKEEPYFQGIVIGLDETKKEAEIKYLTGGKSNEKVKFEKIIPFVNETAINVNDMAAVEDINEVDLLNNMKNRFSQKNIHTNVGPTLIIMNPYQKVEGLYTEAKIDEFIKLHSPGIKFVEDRKNLEEPHLYDVTMIAIMRLQELHRNQAIVISGESGAGKTEAAKNAMKCITYYFGKKSNSAKDEVSLEDQILGCNPILEAFGNSKTLRNDNSSRFGKYVTINLDITTGIIEGANIQTYLLEKSRVCEPAEGERNYHIFYHILKGASQELLDKLYLNRDPTTYKFLAMSKCWSVDTIPDKELFDITEKSFGVTGFSPDEIMTIYKICASCLLLGNVGFKDLGGDKSGVDDKEGVFDKVCKLLDVNPDLLEGAFTNNVRIIQGNVIKSPLKVNECINFRNAFAKEIYNRLFGWIVKKLNNKLCPSKNSNPENKKYIGLLDIFGFECFAFNSLEQMCINFTNEKLQQLYINDVFKAEQSEYIKEGLKDDLTQISFKDNQCIIDLMDKAPMGLFQLIDETCMTNSDDKNYLAKITKAHSANPSFKIPKLSQNKYAIIHTAKDVEYTVTGYIIKNMDEVKITMVECILDSKNPLIKYIFWNCLNEEEFKNEMNMMEEEKKNKNKKPSNDKYLGAKFRKEMDKLITELSGCECHYVRCLKPNEMKKKEYFIPTFVFQQIRYLGVLDTIRVRKEGYPSRKKFKDFFFRFEDVCFWAGKKSIFDYQKIDDEKVFKELALKCLEIMSNNHTKTEVLVGNTRILMKQAFYAKLERERTIKMKKKEDAAKTITKFWKMSKVRRVYRKIKKGAKFLQSWYRKEKFKMKIQKMRYRAKVIQATYRMMLVYRTFKYMRKCVKVVQSFVRMLRAKRKVVKMKKAGRFLNKKFKSYLRVVRAQKNQRMKKIVLSIVDQAWMKIMIKFKTYFAIIIQKHVRRFLTKVKHWSKVLRGREKRMNFLSERSCRTLQRVYRGYRVRYAVRMSNHFANKIQGYWKMIKIFSLIHEMRKNCKTIQRNVRIFLGRKRAIDTRLKEFFIEEEPIVEKDNVVSSQCIFPNTNYINTNNETQSKLEEQNTKIGFYTVDQDEEVQTKKKRQFIAVLPEILQFNEPKIVLFAKILDLDFTIDSGEIYDTLWAGEFEKIYNMNIKNSNPIQQISIGGCHTIVLNNKGKLYSWGWNNYGQCCVSRNLTISDVVVPAIQRDQKGNIPTIPVLNYLEAGRPVNFDAAVRQVICGEDHTFIIDQDHNAYACGDNSRGQLGIGHIGDVDGPTLISELKGKVKTIKTTGEINIAVSTENDLYIWPYDNPNYKYKPLKFFLNKKVTINSVSCGYNFAVLLSNQGILYSFGKSNNFGELGTGDLLPRTTPEPLNMLVEGGEKIVQVSCGYKHTVIKASSGKVYSWGLNSCGQLGIGEFSDSPSPRLISFDNVFPPPYRVKCFQIAASFRASYFLTESRTILSCGTGGDFSKIKLPMKYDTKRKTPEIANENFFTPIKINCSWNKSFSLFYSVMADIRDINKKVPNRQKVNMILNTLASKWDYDSSEPPYIESIAGFFPSNYMKKQKQAKTTEKKPTMEAKIKTLLKKNVK